MENNYSFSKKFVEGEAVSNFWNLAYYGITSLNSFVIIYFLSVYEFGFYQLILSVVAIAESLTAGLMDDLVFTDLSRYLGEKKHSFAKKLLKEYAIIKIGLAIILTVVLFGGASLISDYYSQDVVSFLKIVSFVLVFRVALSTMNTFFRSNIYFSAAAAPFVGEAFKFAAIFVLLFSVGLSITSILIAYVIGHFSAFVFSASHFLKIYRRTLVGVIAVKEPLMKALFKVHGFWIVARYVLSRVANNIRPWIINFLIGTEAVGLFSFARSIVAIIMRLMPLGTFGTLLPRELGDERRLNYLFNRMMKYSLWLGLIVALASFIVIPLAIQLVFPKYAPAIPLFLIMIGVIFLYSIYKICRITLVIFKEQKALFFRSFDNSITAPLMLFILLPIFGIVGAALEWLITYAITTMLFYYFLIKNHPYLRLEWKSFFTVDKQDRALSVRVYRLIKDFLKTKLRRL